MFVRWEGLKTRDDRQARLPGIEEPIVRTFDAPEALGIRFHEVHARSALNRVSGSRLRFKWTVNPYRGCSHACIQCFARPSHRFLDFNPREDFEREIVVKVNVPEVVRAELSRPSWARELVALGTNTDPYQWVESRYRLMPGILEALRDTSTPCSILTRSPLAMRDLSLFREIAERAEISVNFSVPTLDEKAWRATEPHTPHPRTRLAAVAELNRVGIPSGVLIAPLMPGINDAPEQVAPILELAAEAGATFVTPIALHLRGELKEIFFDWLRANRPELLPLYERLYSRGGYLPADEQHRLRELVK